MMLNLDDNTQKYTNRYFNKPLEITYIDNNIKIASMKNMFRDCEELISIDITLQIVYFNFSSSVFLWK